MVQGCKHGSFPHGPPLWGAEHLSPSSCCCDFSYAASPLPLSFAFLYCGLWICQALYLILPRLWNPPAYQRNGLENKTSLAQAAEWQRSAENRFVIWENVENFRSRERSQCGFQSEAYRLFLCLTKGKGGLCSGQGGPFTLPQGSGPLPARPFAGGKPRHGEAGFSWWKSFPVDVYLLCRISLLRSWAQTLIKQSVTWRLYTVWKLVVVQTISVTVQRHCTWYKKKKQTTNKHFAC